MATPRTGNPRGRPRKERPPPRGKGRPELSFLDDRDRWFVVLSLGLMIADPHFFNTVNRASIFAARLDCGIEVDASGQAPPRAGWGVIGWRVIDPLSGEKTETRPGSRAATIAGRARQIRRKIERLKSAQLSFEETLWTINMSKAAGIVFAPRCSYDAARLEIMHLILEILNKCGINEFQTLERFFVPALDSSFGKIDALPD